ncbi:MAG: NAD(P)/FAD-dependent oxidoreductase [Deltaproteobacteria bacterium]|nr:NAD(P)/FAD-dependent oxidoreductase [Deltaproteobacteria bacterium]
MLDAIVIGSGPNGLVAACQLARAGLDVQVLESRADVGGACRSAELTLPGFVHDVGAAFFPFATASPALRSFDLAGAGLEWCHAGLESAHPALDGSCASIARDLTALDRTFGKDADAWRSVARWATRVRDDLLGVLLAPPLPIGAAWRFGIPNLLRLAEVGLSSGRGWSQRRFVTEAARRVVPGLALHTDIGPDDECGAAVGFMLAALASCDGFAVPRGGTSAITSALVQRLQGFGGSVVTGTHVERILVRRGRAYGVHTRLGDIEARAVIADVAAPTLYRDMLPEQEVPGSVLASMLRFQHGFGTFKVDWALDGPVPWSHPDCLEAAVVHVGEDNDDLARFVREVRAGDLPERPYLVVGQQSLADSTRAPEGRHTLWCYSRVPSHRPWAHERERFADRIEARIEGLAPGFRGRILARHVAAPPDLEAMNPNLIGGDLGGGTAQIQQQLVFRPMFPYFRYRTPIEGLYLGSSYAHPGAGVHGMCGFNAANALLADRA